MKRETKEFDFSSLTALLRSLSKSVSLSSLQMGENSEMGKLEKFFPVVMTREQESWLRQWGKKGVSLDDTFNSTRYEYKLSTIMVMDNLD